MPSTFTWLDTSEHDRRRAMEVIDLFRRQTTRDELGIGTIRDALANLLAPGISTIQTRAKYFLLIPWVYQRLERIKCRSEDAAHRGRNNELRIADALANSDDPSGTIGIEAKKALKRLPSSVYWGGLGTWGIRLFSGSLDQYHRSLNRFYDAEARGKVLREDDEAQIFHGANWHPHLPDAPRDFLEVASFALTPEEAVYLQDRIQARVPESLIAFLSQRPETWSAVDFPWEDSLFSTYPPTLQGLVEHARCFSEVLHGAALLYNLMLAEAVPNDDLIEKYRTRLASWQAMMGDRDLAFREWDQQGFWAIVDVDQARIPIPTRSFASRWIELSLTSPTVMAERFGTRVQRELVRDREVSLKRGRARLQYREYLLLWGGEAGADQLDYRWSTAQIIVNDILREISGSEVNADAA